jgi:hypothetical protein
MATYTLTHSSMLAEDYLHTDSILASATASKPLATFLNSQGQSEALVVYEDGELCHLQREPLSSSGWNFCGIGAQIDSIAGANSVSLWIVGVDHNIWTSNAGHWNFVGALDGGAPQIFVGRDGGTYAVINQHGISSSEVRFDQRIFSRSGNSSISRRSCGKTGVLLDHFRWAVVQQRLRPMAQSGYLSPRRTSCSVEHGK